nr:hypothetical protein [Nocardiopsis xinjiangensis]
MNDKDHGSIPPMRPFRTSLSSVMDAPTIIPSTGSGNRAARHSGSPGRNANSYMWLSIQARERLVAGELWQDDDLAFCTRNGTPLERHDVLREQRP